jgi:hypothetical protein
VGKKSLQQEADIEERPLISAKIFLHGHSCATTIAQTAVFIRLIRRIYVCFKWGAFD